MGRIILALIFLFTPVQLWAFGVMMGSDSAAVSGVCSTPSTGDELNEGFIGTGYENTWTETVGTNGTLDEDHTLTGSPPTNSCSEGLLTSVTTSGAATYAFWDRGSDIASGTEVNIYAEFQVKSYTLPSQWDVISGLQMASENWAGSSRVTRVKFQYNGSALEIQCQGSNNADADTISLNTWYTLTVHQDATAASSYCQIDSGTQRTYTRNSLTTRGIVVGIHDLVDSDEAISIEWGRIWVDTP